MVRKNPPLFKFRNAVTRIVIVTFPDHSLFDKHFRYMKNFRSRPIQQGLPTGLGPSKTCRLNSTTAGAEFGRVGKDVGSASGDAGTDFFQNDLFNLLGETLGDLQVPQGMT